MEGPRTPPAHRRACSERHLSRQGGRGGGRRHRSTLTLLGLARLRRARRRTRTQIERPARSLAHEAQPPVLARCLLLRDHILVEEGRNNTRRPKVTRQNPPLYHSKRPTLQVCMGASDRARNTTRPTVGRTIRRLDDPGPSRRRVRRLVLRARSFFERTGPRSSSPRRPQHNYTLTGPMAAGSDRRVGLPHGSGARGGLPVAMGRVCASTRRRRGALQIRQSGGRAVVFDHVFMHTDPRSHADKICSTAPLQVRVGKNGPRAL